MDFKRDALIALSFVLSVVSFCAGENTKSSTLYLLPNNEPVIGAYYYVQFRGAPYIHSGWTPEFEYNNYDNPSHIYALLKTATDYGINCIAFSCGCIHQLAGKAQDQRGKLQENPHNHHFLMQDAATLLPVLDRTFEQNRKLFATGRKLFISIPFHIAFDRSISKGTESNAAKVKEQYAKITSSFSKEPSFITLIDEDRVGWQHTPPNVLEKKFTGIRTIRFQTGIKNHLNVELQTPNDFSTYINACQSHRTAFDRLINQPFVTAKIASELAKYSGTAFFYELSPCYADNQRSDGVRVESDPFLYPYAWTYALSTFPEGIMISSFNNWLDGTAIAKTKEYGNRHCEITERYASVFKSVFASLCAEKRKKKAVVVIYAPSTTSKMGENALYPPTKTDKALIDTLGIIKSLECLSISFDVIPGKFLTQDELKNRRLILVPSGGESLTSDKKELLYNWVGTQEGNTLIVTTSGMSTRADRWWIDKLGLRISDEPSDIKSYSFAQTTLLDRSANLNITDWPQCDLLAQGDNGVPKILRKKITSRHQTSQIILLNGLFGYEFYQSFYRAATKGEVPGEMCDAAATLVDFSLGESYAITRRVAPPSSSYEIKRGPVLRAQDTLITSAVNVIPWGYIVEHRNIRMANHPKATELRMGRPPNIISGHYAENTKPWYRDSVKFNVPVPEDEIVSEVCAIDTDNIEVTDSHRFQDISFTIVKPDEIGAVDERSAHLRQIPYKNVEFNHSLKFYALFAIPLSPVKFNMPELTIHQGETKTIDCLLTNLSDSPITKGTIRLKPSLSGSPGLTMDEVSFSLGTEESANPPLPGQTGKRTIRVQLTFRARPDYVAGNRTAVFEIEAPPGKKALFWRSIKCKKGPVLACRTTSIGGYGGQVAQVKVVLANIGGEEIKETELKLLGHPGLSAYQESTEPKSTLVDLSPEHSRAVTFKINVPRLQRSKLKRPTNPVYETTDIKLSAKYQIFGKEHKQEFPLKLISILPLRSIRRLKRLSRSAIPIYIINPYQFNSTHLMPITISLKMLPSEKLGDNIPIVLNSNGTPIVSQIMGDELTFVAPIFDNISVFYIQAQKDYSKGKKGKLPNLSTDLKVNDFNSKEAHSICVENDKLILKWDGHKLGTLVSFKSKDTGVDYVGFSSNSNKLASKSLEHAHTSDTGQSKAKSPVADNPIKSGQNYIGSFTFRYTKADGEEVVSTQTGPHVKSRLAVFEQGRIQVVVLSSYENDDLRVKDFWSVYNTSHFVRLRREINIKRDLTLKDFTLLNACFIAHPFDMILPNGVGFSRSDGTKGGQLETWRVADCYFAYSGDYLKPSNAAGIIILKADLTSDISSKAARAKLKRSMRYTTRTALQISPKDAVRKVRYGFFQSDYERYGNNITEHVGGANLRDSMNEIGILLRGRTQLKAGQSITLEVIAFAGANLSYNYIQEQAILEELLPLVLIGNDAKEIGGLQTPMSRH